MRRLLPIAFAAVLAACTQHDTPADGPVPPADAPAEAPASPDPTPPAPAAVDWSKDINAVGTEPFWAAEIRKDRLKLSGPDRGDLVVSPGGQTPQGDTAVFEGTAASGVALKITLTVESCSDGMSDLTYPYAARIETAGEMLNGCAAPLDAWPKQPDVQ